MKDEKNKGGAPSLFEGKDSKAVYSLRSSTKGQIEHLATLVPTSASNVIEGLMELPNIGQQVVDLLKRLATEKKANHENDPGVAAGAVEASAPNA